MGDRTYVRVLVRTKDLNSLPPEDEKEFKGMGEDNGTCQDGRIFWIGASDCNYGEWDEAEDFLRDRGIDHDTEWEAGCEYESGYKRIRFVDGKCQEEEMYATEDAIISIVQKIKKHYENKEYDSLNEVFERFTPLSLPKL